MLDGVRGAKASDVAAVAEAFSAFSAMVADLADLIAEIDVNPVIAGPNGCVAIDALVIPKSLKPKSPFHGH
jgi:hypothetical protein